MLTCCGIARRGQILLGHRKLSTSDTDAPSDTGYLRRALEVTDAIIEEIEKLRPGAFRLEAERTAPES